LPEDGGKGALCVTRVDEEEASMVASDDERDILICLVAYPIRVCEIVGNCAQKSEIRSEELSDGVTFTRVVVTPSEKETDTNEYKS
jgi:hypothetical protein